MNFEKHNFDYYHLHFYYTKDNLAYPKELGEYIKEVYGVSLGRVHEQNVGPHPMWSVQLTIKAQNFYDVISFAIKNRRNLIFFIHPVSGDDLLDHTEYPMWVGEPQKLDLSIFN